MSAQANFASGSAEKSKGKAAEMEDVSMGEGDSSEEESTDEVEVSPFSSPVAILIRVLRLSLLGPKLLNYVD
jgi:hypothetical protein